MSKEDLGAKVKVKDILSPREWRQHLALKIWKKTQRESGLEFSDESRANLVRVDELLFDHSVVFYINHTQERDAKVGAALMISQLRNLQRMLGPAGMKRYDLRRDPKNGLLLRGMGLIGVEPLPLVQADDKFDYGKRKFGIQRHFLERTRETIVFSGTVYGIAPEGTRNSQGFLRRAEDGIGHLARYDPEGNFIYYVPVYLGYPEYTEKPMVAIGQPMTLNELIPEGFQLPESRTARAQVIADLHMFRLAAMMPPQQQGVYHPDNWPAIFPGQPSPFVMPPSA